MPVAFSIAGRLLMVGTVCFKMYETSVSKSFSADHLNLTGARAVGVATRAFRCGGLNKSFRIAAACLWYEVYNSTWIHTPIVDFCARNGGLRRAVPCYRDVDVEVGAVGVG